ncbi:MAG: cytochrome P450 [Gammaproteobacteria bacterium]
MPNIITKGWEGFSGAIKRILQGDLGQVDILEKAKQLKPGEMFLANFGWIGGQVAFVHPDSPEQTAAILNYFDGQPDGRRGADGEVYFVDARPIDAQTEMVGRVHNGIFKNVLMQHEHYIDATLSVLSQQLTSGSFSLAEFVHRPLRAALVKHLFHVDDYPAPLNSALQSFSASMPNQAGSFSAKIFLMLQLAYFSKWFDWVASYKKARNTFVNASTQLLLDQADTILNYLHEYGECEGANRKKGDLISLSVIELIEADIKRDFQRLKDEGYDVNSESDENPFNYTQKEILLGFLGEITKEELTPYLLNPYIKTLPATPFAGEMLDTVVVCGMTALARNPELLADLRTTIAETRLLEEENGDAIKAKIDLDRANGGLFYRFFLEALRINSVLKSMDQVLSETLLLRYSNKPASINQLTIPGKTMVSVFSVFPRQDKSKFKQPEMFDPDRYLDANGKLNAELEAIALDAFTQSMRYCPAKRVAPYVFCVMIGKLISEYDFRLEHEVGETNASNVKIEVITREAMNICRP